MLAMNIFERRPVNADSLRAFLAIAECQSLTGAAAQLNKTQSAMSVQLRKLESDLGTQLFQRSTQGMQLTSQGHRLLPLAHNAVHALTQIRATFEKPLTGHLRLGIPDDFDDTVLEAVLTAFAREHPGVEVYTTSGCTARFPSLIEHRRLDVAVCSGPSDTPGDGLSREAIVWAAAEHHQPEHGRPINLAQLERECWWRDIATRALNEAGSPYRIVFNSNSFTSLKAAIRADLAIGILPKSNLGPGLRALEPSERLPALPFAHRTLMVSSGADQAIAGAMTRLLRRSLKIAPIQGDPHRPSAGETI